MRQRTPRPGRVPDLSFYPVLPTTSPVGRGCTFWLSKSISRWSVSTLGLKAILADAHSVWNDLANATARGSSAGSTSVRADVDAVSWGAAMSSVSRSNGHQASLGRQTARWRCGRAGCGTNGTLLHREPVWSDSVSFDTSFADLCAHWRSLGSSGRPAAGFRRIGGAADGRLTTHGRGL